MNNPKVASLCQNCPGTGALLENRAVASSQTIDAIVDAQCSDNRDGGNWCSSRKDEGKCSASHAKGWAVRANCRSTCDVCGTSWATLCAADGDALNNWCSSADMNNPKVASLCQNCPGTGALLENRAVASSQTIDAIVDAQCSDNRDDGNWCSSRKKEGKCD